MKVGDLTLRMVSKHVKFLTSCHGDNRSAKPSGPDNQLRHRVPGGYAAMPRRLAALGEQSGCRPSVVPACPQGRAHACLPRRLRATCPDSFRSAPACNRQGAQVPFHAVGSDYRPVRRRGSEHLGTHNANACAVGLPDLWSQSSPDPWRIEHRVAPCATLAVDCAAPTGWRGGSRSVLAGPR